VSRRRVSHQRFAEAVPELLQAREWSQRRLAAAVGVDPAYICRAVAGSSRPSPELTGRVAIALGLPLDYFPEYREAEVIAAVRRDPQLRERFYRVVDRAPYQSLD
jgi:transcriptional regulator with XRE-family HTH domain